MLQLICKAKKSMLCQLAFQAVELVCKYNTKLLYIVGIFVFAQSNSKYAWAMQYSNSFFLLE